MDVDGNHSDHGAGPPGDYAGTAVMSHVLELSAEWTDWLKDYVRDGRQEQNEQRGLCCYNLGSDPCQWALWSDEQGMALTPWRDLGPDGMVWVEWSDGDDTILGLEYRDDRERPSIQRLGLMHLPSGRETGLIFSGRPVGTVMGHADRLLLVHPHEQSQAATLATGAAVYDRQLREVLPPIANAVRILAHGRIWFWVKRDGGPRWAVYDYRNLRYIVPPDYKELFGHQHGWIGITDDGHSDVRDADGVLLARYDYLLHCSVDAGDELYVERDGLWGKANSSGAIVVEPYAQSLKALLGDSVSLVGLRLGEGSTPAATLDEEEWHKLHALVGDGHSCIRYGKREAGGVPGYVDVTAVVLPEGASALLLQQRQGDGRWLVLAEPWRALPTAAVLRVDDGHVATPLAPNGADDLFLRHVLSPSWEALRSRA